jgi:hypothetical protein
MLLDIHITTKIMKNKLKEVYSRRVTPGFRIVMLIVIVLLGLHVAYTEGNDVGKKQAETTIVK